MNPLNYYDCFVTEEIASFSRNDDNYLVRHCEERSNLQINVIHVNFVSPCLSGNLQSIKRFLLSVEMTYQKISKRSNNNK